MRKIFNFHFPDCFLRKGMWGRSFFSSYKGFTLIELIIVISILAILGTITSGVIIAIIRGTTKTSTIATIRQNGNYALLQLSKELRGATQISSPTSCFFPSLTPIPTVTQVIYVSPNGTPKTVACDSTNNTITLAQSGQTPQSLLDTSRVRTTSCTFNCRKITVAGNPIIDVNFTLTQNLPSVTTVLSENAGVIPFNTSIELRNSN